MRSFLFSSATLFLSARIASAATASQWASRSIYQVMTDRFALTDGSNPECEPLRYCGGTWAGITNHLDYIQGMGFSAVQISPVVKNFPENTLYGEAYHGYWPTNMFALNEKFGTEAELQALVAALHARGMYLMVDVNMNNMALPIEGSMKVDTVLDYSGLSPFNDAKYYHPYCDIDYSNDTSSQICWIANNIVALPDLATEDKVVVDILHTWVKELVSNYSIDGLRIDAAKHVNDTFLASFVEAAGVFTFGEIYASDHWQVCRYQGDLVNGLPNFPVYFPAIAAFANESAGMLPLATMVKQVQETCQNVSYMGTFSENHDLERFAEFDDDMDKALNIVAFTILADGIPTMYQGQEHHFKGNKSANRAPLWPTKYTTSTPIYNLTSKLNTLRTHALNQNPYYLSNHTQPLLVTDHIYATRKGSPSSPSTRIVAIYTNVGSTTTTVEDLKIENAFEAGIKVVDVVSCDVVTVGGDGSLTVKTGSKPKAFYAADALAGSGLCGTEKAKDVAGGSGTKNPDGTENVGAGTGTGTGTGAGSGNGGTDAKKDAATSVRPGFVGLGLGMMMAVGVWLL